MRAWLRRNRSLFCLWAGILLLTLLASACASSHKLAPAQPVYPHRGLNESTILAPR